MNTYRVKNRPFSGTKYSEVYPQGKALYKQIVAKTKRRPYVRSAYFNNEKVFLDYFWDHLCTKNPTDRARRLRQYPCALELIKFNRIAPIIKKNPNKNGELFYRFAGINPYGELFIVQIKEHIRTGQKYFLSVFPV